MNETKLADFNNQDYRPGNYMIIILWYIISIIFFKNYFFPFSKIKIILLRVFGSNIGKNVVIKPNVNIKYPWKLTVGDHSWIGENVWIDNLEKVTIFDNVCISQGAMILCGSHNYKISSFDLITKPITIEKGAWICAKSIVCPGVVVKSHSILLAGSLANSDLEPYQIYMGIPAKKTRKRKIK